MPKKDQKQTVKPKSKQILLVDDDNDFRKFASVTAKAMKDMKGAKIVSLTGLKDLQRRLESIQKGAKKPPGFMIIDLDMETPDAGIKALKAIRAIDQLEACPIVIHTRFANRDNVLLSYSNGANSVVTKPVTQDDQERALRAIFSYWKTYNRSA
jgi:CheY-like chemotaxis protein